MLYRQIVDTSKDSRNHGRTQSFSKHLETSSSNKSIPRYGQRSTIQLWKQTITRILPTQRWDKTPAVRAQTQQTSSQRCGRASQRGSPVGLPRRRRKPLRLLLQSRTQSRSPSSASHQAVRILCLPVQLSAIRLRVRLGLLDLLPKMLALPRRRRSSWYSHHQLRGLLLLTGCRPESAWR